MSKVRIVYELAKTATMGEDVEGWEDEVFEYASSSEEEMNELIKLFEEETDDDYKLELAHILASLKYKKVESYFLKKLESTDFEEQCDASLALIKLENTKGVPSIRKWAENPPNTFSYYWIIEELITANNNISKNLLQELSEKYDYIKQIIQDVLKTKD